MKTRRVGRAPVIHPYVLGDILLEADRARSRGPVVLPVLTTKGQLPPEKATHVVDIIKPAAEDYPALTKTLQVLKFKDENVLSYHEAIGSLINLASGMIWGVGAALAVMDFVGKLLGPEEDAVSKKLDQISKLVGQMYGYLAAEAQKGLHTQASQWRDDLTITRTAVKDVKASRSQSNIDKLIALEIACDRNLLEMLNPLSGEIAFLRAPQGYQPSSGQGGHWIDGAVAPFMALASGQTIDYRNPAHELQSTIWDAGHYIDVLLQALNDRLLLCAALEPAYRTTGRGLGQIKDIVDKLTLFLNKWRVSMLVMDPLAGLNGGGELQHPVTDAPFGIMIGAVDPVSGFGFYDMWWSDFTILNIWHGSLAAKGAPDETRAKDPALARALALDLQPRLLDGTIRASGIHRLAELRAILVEIITRTTVGSDFVDLPNATFDRTSISSATPVDPIDLGIIGNYSKNPGKKYAAQRYSQTFEKQFRFAMALRADVSLIQPGYRIEVGQESIEIIKFANAPAGGGPAPRFPTQPITHTIRRENWTVYDVYQTHVFTEVDEDRFEGADPVSALGSLGRSPAVTPFSTAVLTHAFATPYQVGVEVVRRKEWERLFLNDRAGYVAIQVDVEFDADLTSPTYPFAGYATVTIKNLDPERFRDGHILPIRVFEKGVDANGQVAEWLADHMTVHLVPGFYTVEPSYFTDRREGMEKLGEICDTINEKYKRHATDILPIGPEWQMRRRMLTDQMKVETIERFMRAEGAAAEGVLARFKAPQRG